MYERFTDCARKVMKLANQNAQLLNHEYVGTEHILVGLVKEGRGVGANVLKNLEVDLREVRLEVEKIVRAGPDLVTMGKLPQTPRAKKVIEYAMEESRILFHNHVGTEHLLLGLLREQEGVAAQVLMNLGLKLEDVREKIKELCGDLSATIADKKSVPNPQPFVVTDRFTLDEGPVVLQWPSQLSPESVREFEYWVRGIVLRARRRAGLPTEPNDAEN